MRELAKRAGVRFVTVSRIEMGHMSPTVAMLETREGAADRSADVFPSTPKRARKGAARGK